MQISIRETGDLVRCVLATVGYDAREAGIITDHLIGCELRGVSNGGLSRALSVVERVKADGGHKRRMRTAYETPLSIQIDGGGDVGYLVGQETTEQAIAKAQASGMAVAACNNTWYTGMFAHYLEQAARSGLVAIAAGSSAWRVAPWGSSEGRFGTNPIAFAFPSDGEPIIADLGTSAVMVSEATLAARLGNALQPDLAFDRVGRPTTDPTEALLGAFAVWGSHKGSALAICVQLLGILGGSEVEPSGNDCSMILFVLKPDLLQSEARFRSAVSDYAEKVRAARGIGGAQVRMPFDRSVEHRRACESSGIIDVPEQIVAQLRAFGPPSAGQEQGVACQTASAGAVPKP